jgi:hypothetical protein
MIARAVTFEGVSSDRMNQLRQEIEGGQPPEGLEAKELIALHDPDAETSLVLVFFEDEDAYRRGDEVLGAMDTGDTPGRRTSVTRYDVALRQTM